MYKQPTVLFVIHDSEINSGATRSLVDIIDLLVDRKCINAVALCCGNSGTVVEYFQKKGIRTYLHRFGRWSYGLNDKWYKRIFVCAKLAVKYIYDKLSLRKYTYIMNMEQIDLIYSNTSVVYIGSLLAKKFNVPHIWHIREFCKEDHGLGLCFGENFFVKRVNKADAVIFISKSVHAKYADRLSNAQYVFYNDISPKFISERAFQYYSCKQELHAAIIGTIQKGKGQLEAIKAIEKANQNGVHIILHIAGNKKGDYYEAINNYVVTHNMCDVVLFDGFVRDTVTYRKNMDIGIVASCKEGFGRVTVEGMLNGMLMIGTNTAGTAELIEDGKNGLLYELGHVDDLVSKLIWIYHNQEKMLELAECGFVRAKSEFTQGNCATNIYELICGLVKKG